MKRIHLAAAALNQTPLDWERNARHIRDACVRARDRGVAILCLPELCITGYGCEDAFLSPAVQRTAWDVLHELLPDTRGLITCLGLPVYVDGGIYNACALVVDGIVLGFVAKRALAGDGIHYEPRWFRPWPEGRRAVARGPLGMGRSYPIGDFAFDVGDVRIGFEICEDAWVAQRPGAGLARSGVDIILNPSASHFAFGKHAVRRRLVLEGARAFGVSYVYANLLGNEAGRAIYDGDTLIASAGEVLAEGHRFSFQSVQLISAVVDVELTRNRRSWLSSYQPAVGTVEPISCSWTYPAHVSKPIPETLPPWEQSHHKKEEEFSRAVALGLFDYMVKSRSRGFVVSMSGGADSTAVATLVALAARWAWDELGPDTLRERLAYVTGMTKPASVEALVGKLLFGVYQATRNSSEVTQDAAEGVARGLGATFRVLDVDLLVQGYTQLTEAALGRPLTWERDDIALQNIQARVRSPSVWMFANTLGFLLLSTSNRSEAAVGYATMDGDTSGGLSPIAGIDKAFLRQWLRWMEKEGPYGVEPMPVLALVNAQQPTAELRPAERTQTDEDDLMPYDLLDAIERAAIRDKRGPSEVLLLMHEDFPQYRTKLRLWVRRFFQLFSRNQWKRERYAPSFHLDDANLDPKTWCRWPILSGGFDRELAECDAVELEGERGG